MESSPLNSPYTISQFVPTRRSYILAYIVLLATGIAGTFIGYAMMKVFAPGLSTTFLMIGTIIIAAASIYGVSIIVSLVLKASVEWKSRSPKIIDRKSPSQFLNKKQLH